jgi:hypothetical protein
LPKGISEQGFSISWADEVGRLLVIHDVSIGSYGFSIGIACEQAFCGKEPNSYNNPHKLRCFPMVGPKQIQELEDAYEWEQISEEVHSKSVTFDDVIQNYYVLGASEIEFPQRGSHYKVRFPGNRSWTLDRNVNPIPDRFLKELENITDLPLPVIKSVLLFGSRPRKNVLRIRT